MQEYQHHLYSRQHKLSLKRLSLRQKAQLARMRLAQRNTQREIEESAKDTEDLNSQFCLLCRLNYRSEKAEHQASEAHRKMKKFLMPYCTVCRIGFKSPMEFETHNCTIEHIKVSGDFFCRLPIPFYFMQNLLHTHTYMHKINTKFTYSQVRKIIEISQSKIPTELCVCDIHLLVGC